MKRRFALVLTLLALAAPLYAAEESATPVEDHTAQIDAARAALTEWLKLADAGDFAGMWNAGSAAFKSVVTEAMWTQMGTTVRGQVGALNTRTESSASYSTAPLPNIPPGDYVVIEFTTSFANVARASEVVAATLEADGNWRGVAYGIRPAP